MELNLFERWASLGLYVGGEINPLEDPEQLILNTLENIEFEGRLLGMLTTWLSRYGHLLLTKKIKFKDKKTRRLFSAVVDASGTQSKKLLKMVQKKTSTKTQFVYEKSSVQAMKAWAKKNPHPAFLKQGLILKDHQLIREKILLDSKGVYQRSKILKYRALYGCSLRSDVLAILPQLKETSVRSLAKKLNITHPALLPVINSYVESDLIEVKKAGRSSTLKWVDKMNLMVA